MIQMDQANSFSNRFQFSKTSSLSNTNTPFSMGGGSSRETEMPNVRLDDITHNDRQSSLIANRRVKKKSQVRTAETPDPPSNTKKGKKNLSIAIPRSSSFIAEIQEVSITIHSARNLRPTDGRRGKGDPYCLITLMDQNGTTPISEQITSTIRQNHTNPFWDEIILFDSPDPNGIFLIQIWDQDTSAGPRPNGGKDDFLGSVTFPVHSLPRSTGTPRKNNKNNGTSNRNKVTPGTPVTPLPHTLTGEKAQGTILLSFDTIMTSPPIPTKIVLPPQSPRSLRQPIESKKIVTRREIRSMAVVEQERFCNAVLEMMENGSYKRLAGYHGWPSDYCTHRQENFPAWHRAYLCAFEQELIKADVILGNNGKIGLPYYDWTDLNIQEQAYPVILDAYFKDIPEVLKESLKGTDLLERGYNLKSGRSLETALKRAKLNEKVEEALLETEHWRFASTRWSGGASLETSHNDVHVAFGYPMTSVKFAAFHPIFFLHHCNVDRIFEKYLEMEVDSKMEFSARQRSLAENGEDNRYEQALTPFRHPLLPDQFIYPRDIFVTQELGYLYDDLMPRPSQKLRQVPTYCLFSELDPTVLPSCILHVFVSKKGDGFVLPLLVEGQEKDIDYLSMIEYAGCGSIFGAKKKSACKNCNASKPINLLVDISTTMMAVAVTRDTMQIDVICEDENGTCTVLPDTISSPIVAGATFEENPNKQLRINENWKTDDMTCDVVNVQKYLKRHGYYSGTVDGLFGPMTEQAVVVFQKVAGLVEDGIVGEITKRAIVRPRFDHEQDVIKEKGEGGIEGGVDGGVDGGADGGVDGGVDGVATTEGVGEEDGKSEKETKTKSSIVQQKGSYVAGDTITLIVGSSPGYLERSDVLIEVKRAAALWQNATGITFDTLTIEEAPPIDSETYLAMKTVQVAWRNADVTSKMRFDGPGGILARASDSFVYLDSAELWCVSNTPSKVNAFSIYTVVLHELGHVLGLTHSKNSMDVMAPFYNSDQTITLTSNDIQRVKDVTVAV